MIIPLPQTGHGCPTKVSALPVAGAEAGAEGIEAGDGEDAGTFDSAFAFFSFAQVLPKLFGNERHERMKQL